jgi:uncharacterized membrane protein
MRDLMDWILGTPVSYFITHYSWAWPIAESLHFIALVLLIGTIGVFDLRLLGVAKSIPPAALHRLQPWGLFGFAVLVVTGTMFISGAPDQYFYNDAFYVKMGALIVLASNAGLFYMTQFRRVLDVGPGEAAPIAARVMAAVSLTMLIVVTCAGRMLTFFRPPAIY